jgi:2-oxo-4-hydroxy-4-carboxy-5-ureidoimidazoline decarboxylase
VTDLSELNSGSPDALRSRLLALTESPLWADTLLERRPYADVAALLAASDEIIRSLPEDEVDAALAGHPRIGERSAGLGPEQAERSAREQAGMATADAALQAEMARGNAAYEERFGRIYLVAAAGRSAEDLLDFLLERLHNDPVGELDIVRGELATITRRRLSDELGAS